MREKHNVGNGRKPRDINLDYIEYPSDLEASAKE